MKRDFVSSGRITKGTFLTEKLSQLSIAGRSKFTVYCVPAFFYNNFINNGDFGAVVVTQLVERFLPISEARGSNPVIGKNLYLTFALTVLKRRK